MTLSLKCQIMVKADVTELLTCVCERDGDGDGSSWMRVG